MENEKAVPLMNWRIHGEKSPKVEIVRVVDGLKREYCLSCLDVENAQFLDFLDRYLRGDSHASQENAENERNESDHQERERI
jgi:hypothetical protein